MSFIRQSNIFPCKMHCNINYFLQLIIHISKQKLMSLPARLCFCWESQDYYFRSREAWSAPEFCSSLHEFLHCLYIFQHASLLLPNTFLAPRFDSSCAT